MPVRSFSGEFASIAEPGDGDKLFAPSAARNMLPLCDLLGEFAPDTGRALEIASGTGQHVTSFAAHLPGLSWQPTEPGAERRASIDAHVAEAGLANVRPAIDLDATASGWGAAQDGQNLIFLSNLLHLISNIEAWTLIDEAAAALAPGGRFIVYGPFMRGGELTSDGDVSFHEGLQARDPEVGYKDDFDVIDRMQAAGLELVAAIEMPANNLALIAQAPGG